MLKRLSRKQIWAAVKRQLGIRRVRGSIRRQKIARGLAERIVLDDRTDFELSADFVELLDVVRELNQFGHEWDTDNRPARRTRAEHSGNWLSADEQAHAIGFSQHLANMAIRRKYFPVIRPGEPDSEYFHESEVTKLREELLDGSLLTPEEARRVVASPLLAFFSIGQLRDAGIPLADHASSYIDGGTRHPEAGTWISYATLDVTANGGVTRVTPELTRWSDTPPTFELITLPAKNKDRAIKWAIWPSSVFGRIRKTTQDLIAIFPWQEAQAVWFLLTDEPPHVSPLEIASDTVGTGSFERTKLTIQIEPWVSAEALQRAYRDVQNRVLGRATENRLPPARSLAVFNFCNRLEIEADEEMTWPAKWRAWEEAHSEWSYGDYRSFYTAYKRASRLIMNRSSRRASKKPSE